MRDSRPDVKAGEISSVDLMREMVRFFGLRRTSELIGYVALWVVIGDPDPELAVRQDLGHRTSHYRALADLKRLGDHLRAIGKMPPKAADADRRDQIGDVIQLIRDATAQAPSS